MLATPECNSLEITLERIEGAGACLVVQLPGRVGAGSTAFFQENITKAIDAGFADIMLVVNGPERISAAMQKALARIRKAAEDRGVRLWSFSSRRQLRA